MPPMSKCWCGPWCDETPSIPTIREKRSSRRLRIIDREALAKIGIETAP